MAEKDTDHIPGLASAGFALFLLVAGASAFAHFQSDTWKVEQQSLDARRAAMAEEAAARVRAAETAAAVAQAEAEAADRKQRISKCNTRYSELAQAESTELAALVGLYVNERKKTCRSSFNTRWLRQAKRQLTAFHDDHANLKAECSDVVSLPPQLNGRSTEFISSLDCDELDQLSAEAYEKPVPEAPASAQPETHADLQSGGGFARGANVIPAPETKTETVTAALPEPPPPAAGSTEIAWADLIWSQTPSASDYQRAIPQRARASDYPAEAILRCTIELKGKLDCVVLQALPDSRGFDKAALSISREFRAEPVTSDGRATSGATTRMHVLFEPPT